MPKREDIKSILVIGSGPIVIGQACEFDYSGAQACKVLREEGYRVILVNSNPATIMTDPELADATYVEPITPAFVEKVIAKERPDACLPTLGGQTGLNTAVELAKSGVLERYGVELIGCDVDVIERGEDRKLFNECMADLGIEVSRAGYAYSVEDALAIAEELVAGRSTPARQPYREAIIESLVASGEGPALLEVLGALIQHLVVDQLHLIGDVYDRGPAPQLIMDELLSYPNVDVQWGNHDILWMGAAAGSPGSVANVVRICARYGNLSILEDAYGINLRPLATFAADAYANDPCAAFALKGNPGLSEAETRLTEKVQKAMAVIQFKVEAALIAENPSFGLDDRNLLHLIDRKRGTVVVDGVEYELLDTTFPTVDWDDPYRLTEDEAAVIEQLCAAFTGSERLQRHMRFFLDRGSLYKIENGNLMLHACVPLADDGSLLEVTLFGKTYRGRALYDMVDASVRAAFSATDEAERKRGLDMLWYLWLGPGSPLFAKSKMATFELYLIADKAARKEVKNPFYSLLDDEAVVDGIFRDFGMDPATSRIICGHVPVKVKDGEDPVKAGGRVLCIDGGFSAAYQKTTGLAGFTLVSNAEGLFLDANEPLISRDAAVEGTADIHAERRVLAAYDMPRTVADTDEGACLRERIALLRTLL